MAHAERRLDRQDRAENLLLTSGQWLKLRDHSGRPLAYGIESVRTPGFYHLANTRTCTCQDFARGSLCKHVRAVKLHVERVTAQREHANIIPFPTPQPALLAAGAP